MGESTWKRFLGVGLAGALLSTFSPPPTRAVVGQAVSLLSVAAVAWAVRARNPDGRRAWYCFIGGGVAFLVGHVALFVHGALTSETNPFPSPADAFFVLGYVLLIVGGVLLVRRRSADIEGDNLIDALIVATCVGVVVWAYVLVPYGSDPELTLAEKGLNGAYSLLVLVLIGVAARLAVGSGRRNPSYYLLAASLAFVLAADVFATIDTTGAGSEGLIVVCSALSYVLLGAAALHPSMTTLTARPADREIQLTRRRLILLFAALVAVPALLALDAIGEDGASVPVMAAGSVALSVLVLARLAGLVRAKERKAERERVLREAGEALVAATGQAEMHEAALTAVQAMLGAGQSSRSSVAVGSSDEMTVVASRGDSAEQALGQRVATASLPPPAQDALQQRRPVVVEACPAPDLPAGRADDDVSLLVAPLFVKEELRGAILVTGDRAPGPEAVRTIGALAGQLSLALESASLTEQVHERRHEQRFRALVESSFNLISVVGPDGTTTFVSAASMRLLGVPESELVGQHPLARVHPDDKQRAFTMLERAWASPGPRKPVEVRLRHGNGTWHWFEMVAHNLLDEPEVGGIVLHTRDVTDRKEAQLRMEESEARFRSLVQHSSDVVVVLREDLAMTYVSPSVGRVLGHSQEELAGSSWLDLVHPEDALLARSIPGTGPSQRHLEMRVRHRDGTWLTLDLTVSDLRHDHAVGGIVLNGRDVTDRQALEHQLRHQALHDGLTGLANRTLFTDRVGHALARRSGPGDGVAVLFIDLDDFKTVNDGLGHAAGDALLEEVASRLADALRGGDTAARLGGDEFAVVLENPASDDAVLDVVGRVQSALRAPFVIDGREIQVTASIGVALDHGEPTSADVLLRNADVAMYQAKSRGKNRYQVFEAGMHTLVCERFELKGDLGTALEEEQFRLLYQPIVSLNTGEVTGAEALVRWRHPRQGLLSPDTFIPLAEETGFIVPLGRWVLDTACAQLRRWRDEHPELDLGVSVNVSMRQLESPGLLDEVRAALERFRLPPAALTLEMTESILMADMDTASRRLSELKELEVVLAVDDFGTGYSSLGYLQRFPLDVIKIDRSFIQPLGRRAQQTDVIRAIVDLARSHGLRTVAEGIETHRQVALLQALGCESGQGFHFARPATAAAVEGLLARSSGEPVAT